MSSPRPSPPTKKKENIALYTNPTHDLYLGPASPDLASIVDDHDKNIDGEVEGGDGVWVGEGLREGEVCVAVRRTGICGYVFGFHFHFHFLRFSICFCGAGVGSGMGRGL